MYASFQEVREVHADTFGLIWSTLARQPRISMAKPNYSYEKRQRELAKKRKKEEKLRKKAAQSGDADDSANPPKGPRGL
jgi:hypothetical protein